jgi:hypothetical protein
MRDTSGILSCLYEGEEMTGRDPIEMNLPGEALRFHIFT